MNEWTEQQEQQMIERAKAGDPQANYELSLWALSRSEEEPDEPRWNRLAAKCLVKAAEAGYGPAQKRMAELLDQAKGGKAPAAQSTARRPKSRPEPEDQEDELPEEDDEPAPPEPVRISDARRARRDPRRQSTARRPEPEQDWEDESERGRAARRAREEEPEPEDEEPYDDEDGDDYADEWDDDYADEDEDDDGVFPFQGLFGRGRGRGAGGGRQWGEAQWRKMEIICVAVCAVLLLLIAVMILTGRRSSTANPGSVTSAIPPADEVTAAATPTPEPPKYPDDATIAAIQAADLEIYPDDTEFVTVPTSATVRVSSTSLRLRKGPSTEIDKIADMPDGTQVDIYATKDDWCLVKFNDTQKGTLYGWCSSEYLIVVAGTTVPAATDVPAATEAPSVG